MLTVTRTGSAASISADIRQLVDVRVPVAVAKALTFTAQKAQASILAEMQQAFAGGPTAYTRNSTRIVPASPAKLEARVAVKDQTTNGGNLPEDYLFPQVYGGARKEKRFERLLRFSGLLQPNERAVLGDLAPRDARGNYAVGQLRTLLRSVQGARREGAGGKQLGSKATRVRRDVFVGTPGKPGSLPGIYRRVRKADGVALQPLLVFVKKQPRYTQRLDFEGIARATALREFPATFQRLLRAAGA